MISFLKMATFRNLNPSRGDPRSSLSRRFPTDRFAVVNLGSMGAKVGSIRFVKGVPHIDNVMFLPNDTSDQIPSALIPALRDRSPSGAVVLGISLKAIFNLQKYDQADAEAMEGINGDMRDPAHYAQILSSMESDKTIRGMVERLLVSQIGGKLNENGMDLVRCQIPSISILNRMLADPTVLTPTEGMVNIPIVCDQGMLHAVAVSRGKWAAQRCTAVVSRTSPSRRDDEDEEMLDVLNSCRRSIDQTFSSRDSASRPTHYNFTVVDTGTPAIFGRIAHAAMRLSPMMPGVKVTVERFTTDTHPDLLCLIHETKESA